MKWLGKGRYCETCKEKIQTRLSVDHLEVLAAIKQDRATTSFKRQLADSPSGLCWEPASVAWSKHQQYHPLDGTHMTNLADTDGGSPTNDNRVLGHPRSRVAAITVHALLIAHK